MSRIMTAAAALALLACTAFAQTAPPATPAGNLFRLADANKNNALDRTEWRTFAAASFSARDLNSDGLLVRREFGRAGAGVTAVFAAIDTNNDLALSRAEFLARADLRFAVLDVDGNGALTWTETEGDEIAADADR